MPGAFCFGERFDDAHPGVLEKRLRMSDGD